MKSEDRSQHKVTTHSHQAPAVEKDNARLDNELEKEKEAAKPKGTLKSRLDDKIKGLETAIKDVPTPELRAPLDSLLNELKELRGDGDE